MKLTRRHFAAGLGGVVLTRDFLLHPHRAAAQTDQAPIRFLGLRTPHGADRDFWIPRQPGGGEPAASDQALGELTFEYEHNSLAPMMPWRDKITVIDGIDTQVVKDVRRPGRRTLHGHNEQGTLLTGAAPPEDREGNYDHHPSLDYYLHSRLSAPALLTASVEHSATWKCMSYDDGGRPRNAEQDPIALYGQAFPAGFTPSGGASAGPADFGAGEQAIGTFGEQALRRLRMRLVDSEAAKIDSHLEAMARLRSAEQGSITTAAGAGMCEPSRPTRNGTVGSFGGVIEVARAHATVITQAFACGRARAATLEILNDYPNWFSELPEVNLAPRDRFHETLVHGYWSGDTSVRAGYTAGLRWSATHVAAVLEELDTVVDPLDPQGGSVLDNTIVFWHSEFGHGGHDNQETRHPCVIAGGGGRTLKLGRYLRVRDIRSNERVPHNLLLTSICQAMGLSDVNFFGDRDMAGRSNYQGPLVPLMV
ncbi:MAG: DUF1552 domain-containing protein [Myxococcales bacterium]|nr:DUF1552 domain-containing protein [Myxococcales bacterium]MDD9970130.1 DUF1552 domain-containing protein [Myxococcales bacterium]